MKHYDPTQSQPRIAIVGGGAAGMGAALRLLSQGFHVSLFDPGQVLGGNCCSVAVEDQNGVQHLVDAGVSDFNYDNFPTLRALIEDLGLAFAPINQDASFMDSRRKTQWYTSNGRAHFVNLSADQDRLQQQIARFRMECLEGLDPAFSGWSLGRYLAEQGYDKDFCDAYIYPRAAGCFPMPNQHPSTYDLQGLLRFWRIHGIVGAVGKANRNCVVGGMHRYATALQDRLLALGLDLHLASPVAWVRRRGQSGFAEIGYRDQQGHHRTSRFEDVVFACGPDVALSLIQAPNRAESALLGSFPVQYANVLVHQDPKLMPGDRRAWSAYNYLTIDDQDPATLPTITFDVVRLRQLTGVPEVFVTMNPFRDPDAKAVLAEMRCLHPISDGQCEARLRAMNTRQGVDGFWFCGSYLREPFVHEPALLAGIELADTMIAALVEPLPLSA